MLNRNEKNQNLDSEIMTEELLNSADFNQYSTINKDELSLNYYKSFLLENRSEIKIQDPEIHSNNSKFKSVELKLNIWTKILTSFNILKTNSIQKILLKAFIMTAVLLATIGIIVQVLILVNFGYLLFQGIEKIYPF